MAKPKGWVKEPVRHGLAAKGIKTVKGTREHPMAWFRNPRTGEVSFLPPGVAKREGYTTGPYKSHNAALVMGELRERGQKGSASVGLVSEGKAIDSFLDIVEGFEESGLYEDYKGAMGFRDADYDDAKDSVILLANKLKEGGKPTEEEKQKLRFFLSVFDGFTESTVYEDYREFMGFSDADYAKTVDRMETIIFP